MERARDQLRRQLGFLQVSSQLYDQGYEEEAIRIATVIRVLVHDQRSGSSLITQLDARSIRLLTTTRGAKEIPKPIFFDGFTLLASGRGHVPKLGRSSYQAFVSVDEWWDEIGFIRGDHVIRRRDLVLVAANKDGGAHADPDLPPGYTEILNGMGWTMADPTDPQQFRPVGNLHFLALRQFAYELLNSPDLLSLLVAEGGPTDASDS